MLHSESALRGFPLKSRDGEIGSISDFYFDDRHWAIRYLVADTGNWLSHRKVLISPYALGGVSGEAGRIDVDLTQEQIENSPSLDSDKPVSRQFEESYYGYFGWPSYWSGPYVWGAYPLIVRDPAEWTEPTTAESTADPHLRSANDVRGHHVEATDGEIGHVEDFLIDDATWSIRYLVLDTTNWWPGKKVLVSPAWIDRISSPEGTVSFTLDREVIKGAPEYVPGTPLTREFETRLHQHYQRPGYWLHDPASMAGAPVEG